MVAAAEMWLLERLVVVVEFSVAGREVRVGGSRNVTGHSSESPPPRCHQTQPGVTSPIPAVPQNCWIWAGGDTHKWTVFHPRFYFFFLLSPPVTS